MVAWCLGGEGAWRRLLCLCSFGEQGRVLASWCVLERVVAALRPFFLSSNHTEVILVLCIDRATCRGSWMTFMSQRWYQRTPHVFLVLQNHGIWELSLEVWPEFCLLLQWFLKLQLLYIKSPCLNSLAWVWVLIVLLLMHWSTSRACQELPSHLMSECISCLYHCRNDHFSFWSSYFVVRIFYFLWLKAFEDT